MFTRCLIAAALVAVSVSALTRGQEPRQVPVASIYSTSIQKDLKRLPREIKAGDPSRGMESKPLVFLVAGADIAAAVDASRLHYVIDPKKKTEKKDDTKVDVLVIGNTPVWLVAYLGSTGSQPPEWVLEAVEIKDKNIRLTYTHSKDKTRTADLRPYLYWAPLGMLRAGEYTLELYDADAKKAAMERKCRVEP